MSNHLLNFCQLRLTRGVDLDAPETSSLRRRIIREKGFLRRLYAEWYGMIIQALPPGDGTVLELGSGGGFLKDFTPSLASDVFPLPELVDMVLRAEAIPLKDGCLRGITMTNVLHHIPDVKAFFCEAAKVVRPGGVIAMIEPWATSWARWVYENLHHEHFDADAPAWAFSSSGPLSSSNGALPWILFERDRARFENLFPQWRVKCIKLLMPFSYLLSGGVSLRSFLPGCAYRLTRMLERPFENRFAMFAFVALSRIC